MIVVGIDPGKNGGLAVLCDDELFTFSFRKFENFKTECIEFTEFMRTYNYILNGVTFIESVHARPRQGVKSCFSFGEALGFVEGVFYKNKREYVAPKEWQKRLGLLNLFQGKTFKNESAEYKARKEEFHKFAQSLFPNHKIDLDVADAVLIAEYGRRKLRGYFDNEV